MPSNAPKPKHAPPRRPNPQPAPATVHRAVDLVRRGGAIVTLLGLLAGVPIGVAALTGSLLPKWALLRNAWTTGRIDDQTVVQVGLATFAVLWVWFALTVAAEVLHVMRWQRQQRASSGAPSDGVPASGRALAPVHRTPSGFVRRLVRLALISSTALVGSGLAPLFLRGSGPHAPGAAASWRPATRIELSIDDADGDRRDVSSRRDTDEHATVTARARDTPYSIAVRLGDVALRDRIIDLNRGELAPEGAHWTGGVFPTGMAVRVPRQTSSHTTAATAATAATATSSDWMTYTVQQGDSVFGIAATISNDDHRSVTELADRIIRRNLGRTMVDGRVFDDPSIVLIGWILEVPAGPVASAGSAAPTTLRTQVGTSVDPSIGHVVVVGESYWRIAEDHLTSTIGAAPPPPVVADATIDLRDLNAPLLGHDDPDLILPGEVVRWADAPTVPASAPTPEQPAVAEPTPPVTPAPVSVSPVTPAPATVPPATVPTVTPAPVTVAHVTVATTVAPVAPPTPATSPSEREEHRSLPVPLTIGATVLLAAGAVGLLEARRREQLRRSSIRTRLPTPTPAAVRVETALRRLDPTERAMRIDVALRAAAGRVSDLGRHVVAVLLRDDGDLELVLDADAPHASSPWITSGNDRWRLPADVATVALAEEARRAGQPCPALVHLGRTVDDVELFVDVEAIGLLCVDAPAALAAPIIRSLAATLAASPLAEAARSITVGIDTRCAFGNPNVEHADSLDAALDLAATHLGSTRSVSGGRRTYALRAHAGDGRGECWEPIVIVAADPHLGDELACDVVELSRSGGRGIGIVVDRALPGATWSIRPSKRPDHRRAVSGGDDASAVWTLEPTGIGFVPVGLAVDELVSLHDLLDGAALPLPADEPSATWPAPRSNASGSNASGSSASGSAGSTGPVAPFVEQPWSVLVRVLGGVAVVTAAGETVEFGRSKSLELVAWLGLHRERPTRTAARTALWELDVRAPTFANVVSDARRAMARATAPPEGEEWIERTLTEQLPLHALVVTDAALLQARVDAARGLPAAAAIEVLRPGLELVSDLPFAGTSYLWPDAEGITSALTLMATGAAIELARHHLALDEIDGVFWATGQGLKVLPGHEELIALRMRAYACRGDLAGVRGEWEVYERALHADPWSSTEPSPKLVAVRRELLSR